MLVFELLSGKKVQVCVVLLLLLLLLISVVFLGWVILIPQSHSR